MRLGERRERMYEAMVKTERMSRSKCISKRFFGVVRQTKSETLREALRCLVVVGQWSS